MLQPFLNQRLRAPDASFAPLPGAKLYFYEAGTVTPLNTYADSGQVTPNANPVVADGAGLFGPIYLLPQAYDIILKTTADVTVWSMDDVSIVPTATYKTAAMAGGDAAITAEQDLDSATITLDRNGVWLVQADFDVTLDCSANAATLTGYLTVDGANQSKTVVQGLTTTGQTKRGSASRFWIITISSQPKVVKLRAAKTAGTGTATVHQTHTALAATWLGMA